MPQHDDDQEPTVEFLLTGRREYLDRLTADLEAGGQRITSHEEWLDRVMARFENVQISDFEDMNSVNRPAYSPTGKVYLPAEVYAALEQIRLSGETNMADLEAIKHIAHRQGLPEVATWLDENDTIWSIAFHEGAEPVPEGTDPPEHYGWNNQGSEPLPEDNDGHS